MENLTTTFKQYSDSEQFEEVAQMAKNIKQRLDQSTEHAKLINNREGLVEYEDPTDYSAIQ